MSGSLGKFAFFPTGGVSLKVSLLYALEKLLLGFSKHLFIRTSCHVIMRQYGNIYTVGLLCI